MEDVTQDKGSWCGLGDAARSKQAQPMSKAGARSTAYSWLAEETFAHFFLFHVHLCFACMYICVKESGLPGLIDSYKPPCGCW